MSTLQSYSSSCYYGISICVSALLLGLPYSKTSLVTIDAFTIQTPTVVTSATFRGFPQPRAFVALSTDIDLTGTMTLASVSSLRPLVRSLSVVLAMNADSSSAFVPLDDTATTNTNTTLKQDDDDEDEDEDLLDKVELFGKGAAKAKRGKRKGASSDGSSSTGAPKVSKASLAPEQVFYEGPPAITETLAPTLSIVTVVGIIPAAAAWARQAWVRYKITNRRIRVTSGLNGQDMAEIVYADIVELRTVRRLFGDGDMVAFLRDGAKFEMRNIPNFLATMDYVLELVDPAVAAEYRLKGDVGKN